jgi:C-terminal processing protease CtpA/Prc
MTRKIKSIALLSILLLTPALPADEGKKCTAEPRECEKSIRQMLTGRRFLGITLMELQPGLQINTVIPDSPAERADLRPGDRIMAVNGTDLSAAGIQEFKQVLSQAKGNAAGRLWIIIQRRKTQSKIETRLEPYTADQIDKIVATHLSQFHTASK